MKITVVLNLTEENSRTSCINLAIFCEPNALGNYRFDFSES